jgi:hypothetical protein
MKTLLTFLALLLSNPLPKRSPKGKPLKSCKHGCSCFFDC